MERFRLRILGLNRQLPRPNVIGRGPRLCSAPYQPKERGTLSGGYLTPGVPLPLQLRDRGRPLQSLPEIDLVSPRLTNLDPARKERPRRQRPLAAQHAPRGGGRLIGHRLGGSNQAKARSISGCCRQVEPGREMWPSRGRNRASERTSRFPWFLGRG